MNNDEPHSLGTNIFERVSCPYFLQKSLFELYLSNYERKNKGGEYKSRKENEVSMCFDSIIVIKNCNSSFVRFVKSITKGNLCSLASNV